MTIRKASHPLSYFRMVFDKRAIPRPGKDALGVLGRAVIGFNKLNILRHAGDEEGSFQFCCEIANGGSFSAQLR